MVPKVYFRTGHKTLKMWVSDYFQLDTVTDKARSDGRTFEIQVNIDVKSCIGKTSRFSTPTPFLNEVKEIAYFLVCHFAASSLVGLGSWL